MKTTFADYVGRCPELSLLDQGPLDQPSAQIRLVNGRDDVQNSIEDIYVTLDHGDPKTARVFDGGHVDERPHRCQRSARASSNFCSAPRRRRPATRLSRALSPSGGPVEDCVVALQQVCAPGFWASLHSAWCCERLASRVSDDRIGEHGAVARAARLACRTAASSGMQSSPVTVARRLPWTNHASARGPRVHACFRPGKAGVRGCRTRALVARPWRLRRACRRRAAHGWTRERQGVRLTPATRSRQRTLRSAGAGWSAACR